MRQRKSSLTQTLLPWARSLRSTRIRDADAPSRRETGSSGRAKRRRSPVSGPSNTSQEQHPPASPATLGATAVEAAFREAFSVSSHATAAARREMAEYRRAHRESLRTSLPAPLPSFDRRLPCYDFFMGNRHTERGESIADLLALGHGGNWRPSALEHRHDFIQWMFPLRAAGVNRSAPLLTTEDAAQLRQDPRAMARVLQAVTMMLRFYGTQLTLRRQPEGGASSYEPPAGPSLPAAPMKLHAVLQRSPRPEEWLAQTVNLRNSAHNYLRISRILQFMGEVGLESLKVRWVAYLAHEVCVSRVLYSQLCQDSLCAFWVETPYAASDRLHLKREMLHQRNSSPETHTVCEVEAAVDSPHVAAVLHGQHAPRMVVPDIAVPVGTECAT